jgi:5-(carboxyamino)imidazole ribonucleotide synthase
MRLLSIFRNLYLYFRAMKSFYSKDFRLGVLGGGQLGRMLIQQAINYDIRVAVLDPSPEAPCRNVAHEFTLGDFADYETVLQFGSDKDLLTIEIEHVNVEALEELEKKGVQVYPSPAILRIIRDKGLQKQFYEKHEIPTAPFQLIENKNELKKYLHEFPMMQKLRMGGYDGKGVQALRAEQDFGLAFDAPSVLEKMIDFRAEISVIVARNKSGEIKTFPIVDMEFNAEANLVEFLYSPSGMPESICAEANEIAHKVVNALAFEGLLAIEMFVDKEGKVLVNEIAPRPHNSGHHTIEACVTSQYDQHLRSILNLPLGDTSLIRPSVMINLLGEKGHSGSVNYLHLEEICSIPGVYVHLYGKSETKPFRKMGHVTICSDNLEEAKVLARKIMLRLRVVSIAS